MTPLTCIIFQKFGILLFPLRSLNLLEVDIVHSVSRAPDSFPYTESQQTEHQSLQRSSVLRGSAVRPQPQIKGPSAPKPVFGVCMLSWESTCLLLHRVPHLWGSTTWMSGRAHSPHSLLPCEGRGCSGLFVIPRTFWSQLVKLSADTASAPWGF